MKYLYDLIFLMFSIIYLPYLAIKGKAHKDFMQRFGILPKYLEGLRNDTIWVHAVSVGEVLASKTFIQKLKEAFPKNRVVISTTTRTGNETARRIFKESVPRFYFPLDFHFTVEKTIKFINPKIFILFETEIWPNLIIALSSKNIPIILINGRVSDKSFGGYRLIRFIFANTLKRITGFLMQTEKDAERIRQIGSPSGSVKVCGNVKYDIETKKENLDKEGFGIKKEEDLIICGSTHKGEEEILLWVYKELLKDFHNLRILIAPRHIDRVDDIEKISKKFGFKSIRLSKINLESTYNTQPVLILDTIGELSRLYSIATIVFMGGSLIKRGGHNIVEPARFGKPIIFGPYMHNFRDMADQFLKQEASLMIKNKRQLKNQIESLLKNRSKMIEMGNRASLLIEENKGAVNRIIEEIKNTINE